MKKIIVILAAILGLAGAGFWIAAGDDARPQVLETATVQRADVRQVLECTGVVKPQVGAIVKIGSQATGLIESMLVKVGDRVEKGQLIAKIDDRELMADKAEARARLQRAKANLRLVRQTYPVKIAEAEAKLKAERAEARYAKLTAQRKKTLVAQNLESQDALDDALQKHETQASEASATAATLARLRSEYEPELEEARAAVREANATLENVLVRISHTEITSPLTGVVSQVTSQAGETVVAGLQVANLITVLDPARLEMWIYVDETDVGQAAEGMDVRFTVDAHPDKAFHGRIDEIYPEPEIRDNIVYYKALVRLSPEDAMHLRPEMTTQCRITVRTLPGVLSIPNTAVKWVGGEQAVFVDDDGRVRRARPEFGLAGLERTRILSGLEEGQQVATRIVLPEGFAGGETP